MATASDPVNTTDTEEDREINKFVGSPDGDKPKCPWAGWKAGVSEVSSVETNLTDIMSEQLATNLQAEEEKILTKELLSEEVDVEHPAMSDDTSSDYLIAQMLQLQYTKEHDDELKRVEKKFNGFSKVSISLDNYMMSPPHDTSSEDDEDLPVPKSWDSFEAHEKAFPQLNKFGYAKVNNQVFTKHDATMSGRRNACKVMESLSPCISTGDAGAFDMQLSNKVYNKLKTYSKAEEIRRSRLHDKKEKSTSEMALDTKTRLMLYKLINGTVLDEVLGILSTGKEAVVLYAKGGSGTEYQVSTGGNANLHIPDECAVKVFKTSLNEFKNRDKYIKDDYRFKDRFSKQNPRKIIHMWAEKELHNLNRIHKADIPCPEPVLLKKHVLIMKFIGDDMKPAPKLKEVIFPENDSSVLTNSYQQSIDIITKLYKECNLIHADFSEYNILWHQNRCFVIDVSQSVEPTHPHALEFLYRDCTNICNFFSKKGVNDCHTPESLFKEVCGLSLEGGTAEIMNQIQDYEKNLELLTVAQPEKPFSFEFCWEKSCADKKTKN